MKKIIFIGIVGMVLASLSSLYASEESHYNAAMEAVEAMEMDKNLYKSVDFIMKDQFANLPAEATEARKKLWKIYYQIVSWKAVREMYAQAYQEVFSEEELQWMAKFYKSPFGKRQLKMMYVISDKEVQFIRKRIKEREGEIQKVLEEIKEKSLK